MALRGLKYRVEKGLLTLIPLYSGYVDNRVLAADTNEEVTKPAGAAVVVITCDADIWVDFNSATAVEPAADVTDGTGSVLLPAGIPHARIISELTSFGVISAGTPLISLEWYS